MMKTQWIFIILAIACAIHFEKIDFISNGNKKLRYSILTVCLVLWLISVAGIVLK